MPRLLMLPAQERGRLKASATLQDPIVRLVAPEGDAPCLHIEEGGVEVDLTFPDLVALRRFQRRLASIRRPVSDGT